MTKSFVMLAVNPRAPHSSMEIFTYLDCQYYRIYTRDTV